MFVAISDKYFICSFPCNVDCKVLWFGRVVGVEGLFGHTFIKVFLSLMAK